MAKVDAVLMALKKCQRKLRQLKAGHQLTEQAERTFAQLADAVETVLEDRRVSADRRRMRRATPDRRTTRRGAA